MGGYSNKMLKPLPERRAILDVDNFILEKKKEGLTSHQVLDALYVDVDGWDIVRHCLIGYHVEEKFGDNSYPESEER